MTESEKVAERLETAACPEDVFGMDPKQVRSIYLMLAEAVRPDRMRAMKAGAASARLEELRVEAERRVAAGTYGRRDQF